MPALLRLSGEVCSYCPTCSTSVARSASACPSVGSHRPLSCRSPTSVRVPLATLPGTHDEVVRLPTVPPQRVLSEEFAFSRFGSRMLSRGCAYAFQNLLRQLLVLRTERKVAE